MKNIILMLLLFTIGCAAGISGLIRFQDREYLIHPDKPYLSFPHKVTTCKKRSGFRRILGKKCTTKQAFINIDMNKKEDRDKMISAGFSCKSKMRFKY